MGSGKESIRLVENIEVRIQMKNFDDFVKIYLGKKNTTVDFKNLYRKVHFPNQTFSPPLTPPQI